MKLLEFIRYFPSEDACRTHFKESRDREGAVCKNCGGDQHWWLKSKSMYACKKCRFRMSLRSGTVMENRKLPFLYWYVAMHLMTATKKNISAREMQRQISHKFYEPVWAMVHKLRRVMANRDEKRLLKGEIELDEAFFSVNTPVEREEPNKRSAGTERKAKAFAKAESTPVAEPKQGRKAYQCGHFKMHLIPDLKAETIDGGETRNRVMSDAELPTDNAKSHNGLSKLVELPKAIMLAGKLGSKVLPWVHTAICNAKSAILATYKGASEESLKTTSVSSATSSPADPSASDDSTGSWSQAATTGQNENDWR